MKTRLGFAAALAASALLLAGCVAGQDPAPAPVSTPEPSAPVASPEQPVASDDDFEAAWLDDGRFFAVVTWGSSTCVPMVDTATADGQTVTVTFLEEDETRPCTAD